MRVEGRKQLKKFDLQLLPKTCPNVHMRFLATLNCHQILLFYWARYKTVARMFDHEDVFCNPSNIQNVPTVWAKRLTNGFHLIYH